MLSLMYKYFPSRERAHLALCLCALMLHAAVWGGEQRAPRPTLLVLSSEGGGGHEAACHALQTYLGDTYDLHVMYPINELHIWGVSSCEQLYNKMLKRGWIRAMNFLVRHCVPSLFRSRQSLIEKKITSHIKTCRPDLVISLIPFVNLPASEAARKAHLPFLLVTTDNDLRTWSLDLEKVTHPCMKITIGAELPTTKGVLLQKGIAEECIAVTGLPLRSEFMEQKDRDKLCQEWHFPPEQKRVLVMMGGAGGRSVYDYTRWIGALPLGLHLIVVAGKNQALRRQLETLPLHPSNTLSVFGYVQRVSDLMAVSDVLVTKPGPGTINEAIAMKLPMLLDDAGSSLFWERSNVDLVLKGGIGEKVKRLRQLGPLLTLYLTDRFCQHNVRDRLMKVPSSAFHQQIGVLVQELIQRAPPLFRGGGSMVNVEGNNAAYKVCCVSPS